MCVGGGGGGGGVGVSSGCPVFKLKVLAQNIFRPCTCVKGFKSVIATGSDPG